MKLNKSKLSWFGIGVLCALAISLMVSCGKSTKVERAGAAEAAVATYVAPGDTDEYYLFYSGGHSGQVYVAGVPSMLVEIDGWSASPEVVAATRAGFEAMLTALG